MMEDRPPPRLTRLTGGEKRPYQAYATVRNGQAWTLEIRYARGEQWEGVFLPYHLLRPVEYTGHQRLLLPSTELLVSLEGRYLDATLDLLRDQRLSCLQQFHAWFFTAPEGSDTVITAVHVTPRLAEPAFPNRRAPAREEA